MSKRRKGGESQGSGGSGKRWKSQQKGQLSGPGILLTTVRRKERKAALDLIEFLDDIADELYPDLEPLTSNAGGKKEEADDSLDGLRNGPSTTSASEISEAEHLSEAIRKRDDENDIDAQIQAELEVLRPTKKSKKEVSSTDGKAKRKDRFEIVDLEVECLSFISVAPPMDPVKLSCAFLDEVAKTGQVRGKFVQRLSPIYQTGRADLDGLRLLSAEVISKHFPKEASSFKVEPRMRLHNTLNKMDIIKTVVASVPSPHKAELHHPEYLINVEVFKRNAGIGILPRYEQYKRFNPQMIAQQFSESKVDKGEDASRTLQGK